MLGEYTVKRRTLRRSLAFFYNMIDVTGLVQEKGTTEKASETSFKTAMYAFSGSSLYQPDGDEKPFPSSCSENGFKTAHCDTARRDNTRNYNEIRPGKAAWLAFSLFVTNTQ
ncbi:unnamed protein product [Clavelina lepadiformis]|uniref:Uncharacterized protein n=1 Tax=Clavelina lepadiformis TaxID=159417 RepID=A0ABP0EZP5_CLALP